MNIKKTIKSLSCPARTRARKVKSCLLTRSGGKLIVEGVNVATKHQKPKISRIRRHHQDLIYACKVMVVCPKCGKPTALCIRSPTARKSASAKCGAEL